MLSTTNQVGMCRRSTSSILVEGGQSLVIGSHRSVGLVDHLVPGNRLIENEDGTIEIIPKHLGYIIGEYITRPILDVTYHLTMKSWSLISSAASSFDNMIINLFNPFPSVTAFEIELEYDKFYHYETTLSWPLHNAVMSGDLALVLQLIRFHDIDERDAENISPIERSILTNQKEIFRYLLDYGADIFGRGCRQSSSRLEIPSSISLVIKSGNMDFFDLMIQRHPHPGEILEYQMQGVGNLLHISVKYNHAYTLDYLFTKYHDSLLELIDEKNEEGYAPLHLAALLNDVDAILILTDRGASINLRDNYGYTPLHIAASKKNSEAVETLILRGARTAFTKVNPYELIQGDDFASERTRNIIRNLSAMRDRRELSPIDFSYTLPENLVFQGGGAKGYAYIGSIRTLEKQGNIKGIKRVAGTSAGAITAAFLSLGKSADEIEVFMKGKSWGEFFDIPLVTNGQTIVREGNKILGEIRRLLENHELEQDSVIISSGKKFMKSVLGMWSSLSDIFNSPTPTGIAKGIAKKFWHFDGLCAGEDFRKWVESIIEEVTGVKYCTFGELKARILSQGIGEHKFKDLYIYGTNIVNDPTTVCFNTEDPLWEKMIISDAIRISMSIPCVFKPHSPWFKDNKGHRVERKDLGIFVDGGLINNFPLETFDQRRYVESGLRGQIRNEPIYNRRTLGFSIFSEENHSEDDSDHSDNPNSIMGLLGGIVNVYLESERAIRGQITFNKHRVIKVSDCGIRTLNFNLTEGQLNNLTRSGESATELFFQDQGSSEQLIPNMFLLPRTFESLPRFVPNRKSEILFDVEKKVKDLDHPTILVDRLNQFAREVLVGLAYKAARFGSGYKIVFWIDGETREKWEGGIKRLADALKLDSNKLNSNKLMFNIRKKLSEMDYFQPWLIVINEFNLEPFEEEKRLILNNKGGKVVFSSELQKKGSWLDQYMSEGLLINLLADSQEAFISEAVKYDDPTGQSSPSEAVVQDSASSSGLLETNLLVIEKVSPEVSIKPSTDFGKASSSETVEYDISTGKPSSSEAVTQDSASSSGLLETTLSTERLEESISASMMFFGEKKWGLYFGSVGKVPPLPGNIDEIMNKNCPFWFGKKIKETHLLVLIPDTVDTRPYTINLFGELVKNPLKGTNRSQYSYFPDEARMQIGDKHSGRAYWGLLTRDIIPGSLGLTTGQQARLLVNTNRGDLGLIGLKQRRPTVLEAVTGLMTVQAETGLNLFSGVFTRCQDAVLGANICVGQFLASGLRINGRGCNDHGSGVAAFWELASHES